MEQLMLSIVILVSLFGSTVLAYNNDTWCNETCTELNLQLKCDFNCDPTSCGLNIWPLFSCGFDVDGSLLSSSPHPQAFGELAWTQLSHTMSVNFFFRSEQLQAVTNVSNYHCSLHESNSSSFSLGGPTSIEIYGNGDFAEAVLFWRFNSGYEDPADWTSVNDVDYFPSVSFDDAPTYTFDHRIFQASTVAMYISCDVQGDLNVQDPFGVWASRGTLFAAEPIFPSVPIFPCAPFSSLTDPELSEWSTENLPCPVTCLRSDAEIPPTQSVRPGQCYGSRNWGNLPNGVFEKWEDTCSGENLPECASPRSDGIWSEVFKFDCNSALFMFNSRISSSGSGIVGILEEALTGLENNLKCHARDNDSGGDATLTDEVLDRFFKLTIGNALKAIDPATPLSYYENNLPPNIADFVGSLYDLSKYIRGDINSACSYSTWSEGKGCRVKWNPPLSQMEIAITVAQCPDREHIPFFKLEASGAPLDDFYLPCSTDDDCLSGRCAYPDYDLYSNIANITLSILEEAFLWLPEAGPEGSFSGVTREVGSFVLEELMSYLREEIFRQSAWATPPETAFKFCSMTFGQDLWLQQDPTVYANFNAIDPLGYPATSFDFTYFSHIADTIANDPDYQLIGNLTSAEVDCSSSGEAFCFDLNEQIIRPHGDGMVLPAAELYSTDRAPPLSFPNEFRPFGSELADGSLHNQLDIFGVSCNGDFGFFPTVPFLSFSGKVDATPGLFEKLSQVIKSLVLNRGSLSDIDVTRNFVAPSLAFLLTLLNDVDTNPQPNSPLQWFKDLLNNVTLFDDPETSGTEKFLNLPASCSAARWLAEGRCTYEVDIQSVISAIFGSNLDLRLIVDAKVCPDQPLSQYCSARMFCQGLDCGRIFVPVANDFCKDDSACPNGYACQDMSDLVPPLFAELWRFPSKKRIKKEFQLNNVDGSAVTSACSSYYWCDGQCTTVEDALTCVLNRHLMELLGWRFNTEYDQCIFAGVDERHFMGLYSYRIEVTATEASSYNVGLISGSAWDPEDAVDLFEYEADVSLCEEEWRWMFYDHKKCPLTYALGILDSSFNSEYPVIECFAGQPLNYSTLFGSGVSLIAVPGYTPLEACKDGVFYSNGCQASGVGYNSCASSKLAGLELLNLFHRISGNPVQLSTAAGNIDYNGPDGICFVSVLDEPDFSSFENRSFHSVMNGVTTVTIDELLCYGTTASGCDSNSGNPEVNACTNNPCPAPTTVCTDIQFPDNYYDLDSESGRTCSCPPGVVCDPPCALTYREGTTESAGCGACLQGYRADNLDCVVDDPDGCANAPCPPGSTCTDCSKGADPKYCPNDAKYWEPNARLCEGANDLETKCANLFRVVNEQNVGDGSQADTANECFPDIQGCGCCQSGYTEGADGICDLATSASPARFQSSAMVVLLAGLLALGASNI